MDPATILLIEDNPDEEALVVRALQKNNIGKKVVVVRDGAEALDFFFCRNNFADRDPREMPKLTLLDLRLPKMDGLDVLRRLREDQRTRLLPVVILSSSNEEKDVAESYRNGANSYVQKSIDFPRFIEEIKQIASYWLGVNELPTI
jgi:two-component system response regulator